MKIIHVITSLSTGGAQRALYNYLKAGLKNYAENHVVSMCEIGSFGERIENLGVPVISLGMKQGQLSLTSLFTLCNLVRRIKPELIQGWMYHANIAVSVADSLVLGRRVLSWSIRHSLDNIYNEKWSTRQVIRASKHLSTKPDIILYNSHISRLQHEKFGFCTEKSFLIRNGIDVEKLHFLSKCRKNLRNKFDIPMSSIVIGHVARYHPMKDHSIFLQTAVDLALKYRGLHFLLCGNDISIENPQLKELIPAEMRNRFHLLGERSDISKIMSAIDIFCLSSAWGEGFPNVIGEAMATSIPCVVTDVGDSSFIVQNTGIVVPPRNKEMLFLGIEKLITMPSEKRNDLGRNARLRIIKNNSLNMIVDRYFRLCSEKIVDKGV